MGTEIEHLVITGNGFISSNLRKHFESEAQNPLRVLVAGRTGTPNSISALVRQYGLQNFGVILSGWRGVTKGFSQDSKIQEESLADFKNQLEEIAAVRPSLVIGFGSQIEKSVMTQHGLTELTAYGRAKIEARSQFEKMLKDTGLIGKWIYIFSVYGVGMDDSWLLPQLVKAAALDKPLEMGKGHQKWGFLHISDFSAAMEAIIRNPEGLPFEIDIGGEASRSLRELVLEIEQHLGKPCASFSKASLGSRDSVPDLRPLRELGWNQRKTLREGILELMDTYA